MSSSFQGNSFSGKRKRRYHGEGSGGEIRRGEIEIPESQRIRPNLYKESAKIDIAVLMGVVGFTHLPWGAICP